jgi:hypothetical protein
MTIAHSRRDKIFLSRSPRAGSHKTIDTILDDNNNNLPPTGWRAVLAGESSIPAVSQYLLV